jgi:hypothetical protein
MVVKMIEINKREIKSGVLIIEIYYNNKDGFKNYTQQSKKLFGNLPKKLKGYGSIKPILCATIKYRNYSVGCILKYHIEYATQHFFLELFQILNKKKKSFIMNYNIMISEYVNKEDFKNELLSFVNSLKL